MAGSDLHSESPGLPYQIRHYKLVRIFCLLTDNHEPEYL